MSGIITVGEIAAASGDAYGAYQGGLVSPSAQASFGAAVAAAAAAIASTGRLGGFPQGLGIGIAPAASMTQLAMNINSLQNAATPADGLAASLGILGGAAGTLAGLMPPSPQKAALTAIAIAASSAQILVQNHEAIEQVMSDLADTMAKGFIDAGIAFGNAINGIEQSVADLISAAMRFVNRRDPLTLDLNNNGLETVPVSATNPVYFDLTGEGVQSSVGWVAPNDGFLTLDRNGDGLINDGTELFGDATPAYEAGTTTPTTGKTADGFEALAQEDTNGDGIVNSGDANFANLRVWQDLNQDGVC